MSGSGVQYAYLWDRDVKQCINTCICIRMCEHNRGGIHFSSTDRYRYGSANVCKCMCVRECACVEDVKILKKAFVALGRWRLLSRISCAAAVIIIAIVVNVIFFDFFCFYRLRRPWSGKRAAVELSKME